MLCLGDKTRWGVVSMIAILSGERYYWMIDKHGTVSMMPAIVVEENYGDQNWCLPRMRTGCIRA